MSVRLMASVPVTDFQPMLDSPCPRRSALTTRYPACASMGARNR